MSWLTPLGFLGLIGLIVLIIIYIIKPNYQNKIISSTYVWKLSLKYRRKKVPLSKLRNIILFICQVLTIVALSLILAQPIIPAAEEPESKDKVLIIDASASMLSTDGLETRFERAVSQVGEMADAVLDEEGTVSIILAGEKASFLIQDAKGPEARRNVDAALAFLVDPNEAPLYTYGTPDIDGAMKLAEEITASTPHTEVVLFTDTNYIDKGDVTVKSVVENTEWNAAILDVRAIVDENFYRFEIDVASYGKDADITVYCDIFGVNNEKATLNLVATKLCSDDRTNTVTYVASNSTQPDAADDVIDVYSFEYVSVRIDEFDSFEYDNSFYLYGGAKPELKIQYYSSLPNNYFGTALMVLRDRLQYRWDVEYTEVKHDEVPATEGFDVYIYEHTMPSTLPTDGVILLANPDEIPSSAGLRLGKTYQGGETPLSMGEAHPITKGATAENITVTKYTQITSYDGYTPLLYVNNDPVFMVKNEPEQKIAVMSFSLNYSNLPLLLEFPLMMYNMFEYFVPSTMSEYVFDVNESISLNSRSDALNVMGPSVDQQITEFPTTVDLKAPGVYTVTQTIISNEEIVENFYVKVPETESDILLEEDVLTNPYFVVAEEEEDRDLLLYFALALVALLFVEWWLQTREQF